MTTAPPLAPGSAAAVMLLALWRSGGRPVRQVTWPFVTPREQSDVRVVLEILHQRYGIEIDAEVANADEAERLLGPDLLAKATYNRSGGLMRFWYNVGVERLWAALSGRVVNGMFVASHTGLDHTDIPLDVILAGQRSE